MLKFHFPDMISVVIPEESDLVPEIEIVNSKKCCAINGLEGTNKFWDIAQNCMCKLKWSHLEI